MILYTLLNPVTFWVIIIGYLLIILISAYTYEPNKSDDYYRLVIVVGLALIFIAFFKY